MERCCYKVDTAKCNLNWKTCGYCHFGINSHGHAYGSCGKVGFWGSLLGCDICLNAPPYGEEEQVNEPDEELKDRISCWKERKVYEEKARRLYETIEEMEEVINDKNITEPIEQLKPLILHAKFLADKLRGGE